MVLKEKYKFLTDFLAKMSQNIFAYLSISEHSASFSLFEKQPILVADLGLTPPPVYGPVRNFFLRLPSVDIFAKNERFFACSFCLMSSDI